MHCRRFVSPPLSRRAMLSQCANGFGALALLSLFGKANAADGKHATHHPAKAKNVIFLYMDGGPSQMDTFDPKPRLTAEHGQPFKMKMEPTQFNNNGSTFGSPWNFAQHGKSGLWVSELFPHVAKHADKLCVVRSMTSEFSEHTSANYFLHTGNGLQGRPSMGAWFNYGLGSECEQLPGFVVLNGGLIPPGGLDNFNSGFLPASFQASVFRAGDSPVANLTGPKEDSSEDAAAILRKRELLAGLDAATAEQTHGADAVESAIANYEMAYRMQTAVPELMNVAEETPATLSSYGVDHPNAATQIFGRQCLIARRLIERGVRFVELTCPDLGADRWDQHGNLKGGHEKNALAVDQPIAGLLADLESRGMLHETLVVWAGEFGRTPFAQGSDGRDHNPFGFTVWLAGGGVKGGMTYGATDEYGYHAIENRLEMHDLHATMLHLVGLDHKRVTYRFGGRDMRLTDVFGNVITPILA